MTGRDGSVSLRHLLVRYDFRLQLRDLLIKFDFLASGRFQKSEIKNYQRQRGNKNKRARGHFHLTSLSSNKTVLNFHPVKRESLSFHGCYLKVSNGFKM